MIDAAQVDSLAARFEAALTSGDRIALDALLAPEFTIWYNFSDTTISREQALAFFGDYFTRVTVRFRGARRLPTPVGWVQQHRVDAEGPDGFRVSAMPACLVFTLAGERIAHIDEYFDSAAVSGFDRSQMSRD